MGGDVIEQVSSYKYLGLDIKGNLRWDSYKKRLLAKAEKRMIFVWSMGIQSRHFSVTAAVEVWKPPNERV